MTSIRRILIMILASIFALFPVMSGPIAFAGHQLQSDRSATLSLTPTEKAGDATGKAEVKVSEDDSFNDSDDRDDRDDDRDDFDDDDDFDDRDDFNDDRDQSGGTVQVTGDIEINGLSDPARVEAFLVDNDGRRSVDLGRLSVKSGQQGRLTLNFDKTVDDLQDFDRLVITREPENDTDPNPSPDVLFDAALPHQ